MTADLKHCKHNLKPAEQTQMTADLKVKPGLPCKHNLKPANQTQMTTFKQKRQTTSVMNFWKEILHLLRKLCVD